MVTGGELHSELTGCSKGSGNACTAFGSWLLVVCRLLGTVWCTMLCAVRVQLSQRLQRRVPLVCMLVCRVVPCWRGPPHVA